MKRIAATEAEKLLTWCTRQAMLYVADARLYKRDNTLCKHHMSRDTLKEAKRKMQTSIQMDGLLS